LNKRPSVPGYSRVGCDTDKSGSGSTKALDLHRKGDANAWLQVFAKAKKEDNNRLAARHDI